MVVRCFLDGGASIDVSQRLCECCEQEYRNTTRGPQGHPRFYSTILLGMQILLSRCSKKKIYMASFSTHSRFFLLSEMKHSFYFLFFIVPGTPAPHYPTSTRFKATSVTHWTYDVL